MIRSAMLVVLVASVMGASIARAEAPVADIASTAAPAPATADIERARARADEILVKGRATAEFVNITDSELPSVQHKASGLICHFIPGSEYSAVEPLERGGAACSEKVDNVYLRIWLSPSLSFGAAEVLTIFTDVEKRLHPDAAPYTGQVATVEADGVPTGFSSYLTYKSDAAWLKDDKGKTVIFRASVAHVRGWDVKMRATTLEKDAQSGVYLATISGMGWLGALRSVAQKPQ